MINFSATASIFLNEKFYLKIALLILFCGIQTIWAEGKPSGNASTLVTSQPAGKPMAFSPPKVTYLEKVWKPLGPELNLMSDGKRNIVIDNNGTPLFSRSVNVRDDGSSLDFMGWNNGCLYCQRFANNLKSQAILLLTKNGKEYMKISEVLPYKQVLPLPESKKIIIRGRHPLQMESTYQDSIAAYSMETGDILKTDLPKEVSIFVPPFLAFPEWKKVVLFEPADGRYCIRVFDQYLKQIISKPIARNNQKIEFSCKDKNTVYVASTTPKGFWDLMYYDLCTGKLSSAPFFARGGDWYFANAIAAEDGKLIVWGKNEIQFLWPKNWRHKQTRVFKSPPSPSKSFPQPYEFLREPAALADDGRFALVAKHRSQKPLEILIYDKNGQLYERIVVIKSSAREGRIEHLKFIDSSQVLLVFAKDYTARILLKPLPKPVTREEVEALRKELLKRRREAAESSNPEAAREELPKMVERLNAMREQWERQEAGRLLDEQIKRKKKKQSSTTQPTTRPAK